MLRTISILILAALASRACALEAGTGQMALAIADGWNSSSGRMQLFERDGHGWRAVAQPWRVLYGKNGLAWGRGEHAVPEDSIAPAKQEHDRRTPAGIFQIGKIYTYDSALPAGADYPFHTIGANDAWIDDPALPNYNKHVTVNPANPPPWFEKQRMRLNDPPHRWLVEIRHNSAPPIPGAGSAMFFHIQRGPDFHSSGCTVMPQADILRLITWLREQAHPRYVLLPKTEYLAHWKAWGLPSPTEAASLLGN